MDNFLSSICVEHYEGKAIFIDNDNNVYYVSDKNEVLPLGCTIEENALVSIDELSENEIKDIVSLIERN